MKFPWRKPTPDTTDEPAPSTGPVVVPNDSAQAIEKLAQAEILIQESVAQKAETLTWFERVVAPTLEELRVRREQNGFGQEFELSIQPKTRGTNNHA